MMLPDSDRARVDRAKITDYLLSLSHPDGRAPMMRTVWLAEAGRPPRLVTAYPL